MIDIPSQSSPASHDRVGDDQHLSPVVTPNPWHRQVLLAGTVVLKQKLLRA
jgi:hypothetical protein